MVSTRNTSRGRANPPRMQDQQGNTDSRPPAGELETIHNNTNEMETLYLTNQRLIRELEQLTKQLKRPREIRPLRKSITPPLRKSNWPCSHGATSPKSPAAQLRKGHIAAELVQLRKISPQSPSSSVSKSSTAQERPYSHRASSAQAD